MRLSEQLRDWQDLDVAGHYLAVCLGLVGGNSAFPKAVMWTDNPLGNGLVQILKELVAAGVLQEDDERVRWNPDFSIHRAAGLRDTTK